jgi:hypothetical protein
MIEYYLLKCGCVMTSEKINDKEYRYNIILPRCVPSGKEKKSYISDVTPEGYDAKLLTKFEASVEIMQG